MKKKKLYVGTKSPSRQHLLKASGINFSLVDQDANEHECDWGLSLQKLVESIAQHKMDHVVLPEGKDGDICYVLTADTLGQDSHGTICGKPTSKKEAIEMLKRYRFGAQTGTGICVDRKKYINGAWHTETRIVDYAEARYIFEVPDDYLERYVNELPKNIGVECTEVSGGVAIEGYGGRFLKTLSGSYTAVIGLPLYELQIALDKLGFFD